MESFSAQIRHRRVDAGQATIEFALLLPLFALCIGLLISAIGIGLSSIRLADTARLAARAASTSENPGAIVDSIVHDAHISHTELIDSSQQFLTVTLFQHLQLPFLNIRLPGYTLTAQSTVLIEAIPILQNT